MANFKSATVIYVMALSLIALLSVGAYVSVDSLVVRQEQSVRVIDIAGRQRMLSQRIAELATELATRPDSRSQALTERLRAAIDVMEQSHVALRRGSSALGISPPESETIRAIFEEEPHRLNQQVASYTALARSVLAADSAGKTGKGTPEQVFATAQERLLSSLDAAIGQYRIDNENIRRHLRKSLLGVLILTLCTLAAEAVWIFRPLFRDMHTTQANLLEAARTDPLTGSMNRRHLLESGNREVARCRRKGEPLTVMILDIDHFKSINDRFGHATGAEALIAVVRLVVGGIRVSDLLGRIGGEEFALILPDTPQNEGLAVAEKMRETIAATPVVGKHGFCTLTVSIGVTQLTTDDDSVIQALDRADQALYEAKRSGRNRVVGWTEDLQEDVLQSWSALQDRPAE